MSVEEKLAEAGFFLEKLRKNAGQSESRYYCSAFVTAARSVLDYVCPHAKKNGTLCLYKKQLKSNKILEFFRCQRNLNIHERPIPRNIRVRLEDQITASEERTVSRSGRETDQGPGSEAERVPETPAAVEYHFADWLGGDGKIVDLSTRYLREVKKVVDAYSRL